VDASALPKGSSSSKDDDVDLSPPAGDAAAHPNSPSSFGASRAVPEPDVNEMHPWDPHQAAKDVEVGDFYFRRKNYRAAESRYREALLYKNNDAIATYRLAVSLEKLDRPDEAREEYESYLKILPEGHDAEHARKALERLKNAAAKSNPAK
jgi:tetratricopeptide (TPR) repeat protein